jgi:hypothetical protein
MNSLIYEPDENNQTYIEVPHTTGSDYVGGPVERYNYEHLKEHFHDTKGVYQIYGDFGTYGIGYIESEVSPETLLEIKTIIDALENYPLINEDDFFGFELELKVNHLKSEYNLPESFTWTEEFYEILDNIEIETGCLVYVPNRAEEQLKVFLKKEHISFKI